MKERIINIIISYAMRDIPVGATITPKERVKELVKKEMMERFGWDEGFEDLTVDVIDID